MESFLMILIMLAAIGLSNMINHIVPFIPVPLIQIALGVLIAAVPGGLHIPLEPELFFVLFIAPILFNDGKNVSRKTLWNLRKQILLLALGLVFLTVLVIGFLTHWLIPSIPLSAAFALAAILSPTDIVAVSAMSSRVRIPKSIMHLLEGEGLMNDASGLVAFNFAIAATVTGAFSLGDASLSFLKIAVGGFAGGAVLAFLIIRLRLFIRRLGMEDVTFHMLIQILTPFVVFLLIEHIHLSGILAVVAAGIVHAMERDYEESPTINLQVVSRSTWIVLLYVLNGLVFVLLGSQIPDILNEIFNAPTFNNAEEIAYTLVISLALFALRFIWLHLLEWSRWKLKKPDAVKPGLRRTAIAAISGVRGAVTLAGAFSIPFVLADGSLFPQRSLMIFIAAGVILVTLITASIVLPLITKSENNEVKNNREKMEKRALIRTYEAAVRAMRGALDEDKREAALKIMSTYNHTLQQLKSEENGTNALTVKKMEAEIRMKALEAESQCIAKLTEEKRIDKETALLAQARIRRREVAVTNRSRFRILMIWTLVKRILYQSSQILISQNHQLRRKEREKRIKLYRLRKDLGEAAIRAVKKGLTPENREISYLIIGEYIELMTKIKSGRSENYSRALARMERELKEKAFQAERDEIQKLYENGKVTRDVTQKIRRQINIREAYSLEEEKF
ncbi:sodium/proton antiporter, CPA1 family [Syntrophobotulus glycolicus DSM 8271]|uniref:Sodium/proton antiporter, CPA1 family n=1 Tax=Syntrophobotulus glycolicus (strain DSM 8271 / FlGlyR) TaxID=645991 RepID=F0SWG2_SYNGF|nr:Na+/H+ antiporter [Syntrophobotulus glycolicus]ADY55728.1 sodium/proton antiporter, CPA1 family [Syntrophobotulus glycolicus DSM 8271]